MILKRLDSVVYAVKTFPFASFIRRAGNTANLEHSWELYRLDKGPPTTSKLSEEIAMEALKYMLYIRRTETKAAELYRERLINGFCHLYSGQEAISVGVKLAMQANDTIITAYRCHGIAALFGISAREILAELMGRKTGASQGKGGSMHMYGDKFFGGDGIVGGQVPVGTGIAFAHKYVGNGAVSFALYGDGASNQGQLFEAWNMAKLWGLPVVYICENNKFGMGTATHRHAANDQFFTRGDNIPGIKVDAMKVMDVAEATKFARDYAMRSGPIVLEFVTYRYYGHSMSDPGTGYRTREEVKEVQQKQDPLLLFMTLIVENKLKSQKELEELQKAIYVDVDKQLQEAKADPWPEQTAIGEHVYAKKLEQIRGLAPWKPIT